jgi:hypothetical protein
MVSSDEPSNDFRMPSELLENGRTWADLQHMVAKQWPLPKHGFFSSPGRHAAARV